MLKETKKPRKVITSYLVYCNKKPVLLTRNKKEAESLVSTAKENGHDSFYKDLTATEERIFEIGKNLFINVKKVPEQHIQRILEVRSKLIRETFEMREKLKEKIGKTVDDDLAWEYLVQKNYGKPYNEMTYSEFNTWTLDINEFYLDTAR